jgi:uncharacterized Zn finger protein (UPF0148 family)
MGLCPVCGKYLCDHTAEERGQTPEEMMKPLTPEEEQRKALNDAEELIQSITRNPEVGKIIDWEAMNNRLEGRNTILERQPDGTFKTTPKN